MGKYQKTKYPGIFKYVGSNGESYGIDYYAGGKKHREIIGSLLGEAQKKLSEKKNKKGPFLSMAVLKKKTFEDLAKEYEGKFKNDSYFQKTRKYYLATLKDHFGAMRLREIGTLELDTFKTQRKNTPTRYKRERSGIAVNRELETLSHMFNKAMEWGWMEVNPFTRFKESPFYKEENNRVRYLEEDESKRLFLTADIK